MCRGEIQHSFTSLRDKIAARKMVEKMEKHQYLHVEHRHQEAEYLHVEHRHQEEIRRIPRELIEHEEQWQIIQYCQQEQLQVLLQEQQFQEIEYD